MKDKAKKLAKPISSPSPRRLLRTAWAGAVATVAAGGLLFTASANVPASHVPDNDRDLPIQLQGLIESAPVRQTETAPDDVSLDQIVAVLERADKQAREQGPDLSPTVAQATAELGMLYTTYKMQQLAFGEKNYGLRIQDAPVARVSKKDDGANDGVQGHAPQKDVPSVVQASYEHTSVVDPHAEGSHTGYVTYDQVVIAAVRLANMLDSSVPNALVEVQRADQRQGLSSRENLAMMKVQGAQEGQGFSLRESLLDVVAVFGGSTLGYANGRIPAAVLCPLEFAPGHMLRCDAAERLTALSDKFEREFGYPIPITDSYRSYVQQIAVASAKPHLAAVPGTSNHGWGLAVDLSNPIAGGASAEYVWLRVHGPAFGWDNPSWARPGGTKPEPWHFEFFAAGAVPDRAIEPSDVGTWGPTGPSDSSDGASPRYKPALDPKPKDGSTAGGVHKPPTKPADGPSTSPPSQRPSKPTPKPTPSDPAPKPTTPTTGPSPSPTPSPLPSEPSPEPSASPTPSPTPSPSPSPSPSEPGQEPSASPTPPPSKPSPSPTPTPAPSGDGETPHAPTPSPSPSVSSGPLSSLAKSLGLAVDDTED
ncbi:M15 family metallopeptidase [Promicromonospora sp. NPDC050249]|uniref:M15 family metallopeptidase n=1 Tax=Promicromonospora sp. NPDC050249 TaxID=3154743 RepID=UPI0033CCA30F